MCNLIRNVSCLGADDTINASKLGTKRTKPSRRESNKEMQDDDEQLPSIGPDDVSGVGADNESRLGADNVSCLGADDLSCPG